ncbi:hypothetical protein HMPREF3193_00671 [Bifidobacterium breve]|nr:hypothetical protein HMPREF1587_02293 [Bifidobacterium breve JCP7499]KWZ86036.1 hypothetical protein HMPREF3193_00671 [Bifidobacterium breve]
MGSPALFGARRLCRRANTEPRRRRVPDCRAGGEEGKPEIEA